MRMRRSSVALGFLLLSLATVTASSGQTFTTLAEFNYTNGYYPDAEMTQGVDGNLYGTTVDGGLGGSGTFFTITTGGQLTSLYTFCSLLNCSDGAHPYSALVQDKAGNFWGTSEGSVPFNLGTVFKVTASGILTTVHNFNITDGEQPKAGLIIGSDGNFYGTTSAGGANNAGTIFKITPAGVLTTLHDFDFSDGNNAAVSLVQATNGAFYGTTLFSGLNGGGTIFRITASGTFTTLHNFCSEANCADGEFPWGTLIQATDGNLYGTTSSGGTASGCNNSTCGTVFKITPTGVLTTVYSFCTEPSCLGGGQPVAGLVQGTDGLFYGVTTYGGSNNEGTIFNLTPSGNLTILHTFDGADGYSPNAGLMQHTNGAFYGTAFFTIFSLSAGLGPFVRTSPPSGKVGASVIILGTNLTGATSVSFNGKAAGFSVVSDSEIKTAVPAGATTGTVKVTTATQVLKSNVAFRVIK